MSMIIAHNNMAINTQKNLGIAGGGLSKSMEKLSSGYRINVGADGPADLVISEQLRSQLSGLDRAVRNTSDAYNVIAISEGAMNEMNNILKKMKQLAIHSASTGVTSSSQVAADQAEMDSAIQTIDKIANTTRFSDQQLLNGNKQITYNQSTTIKGTQQNSLLNTSTSKFDQVFRLSDYQVAINYTGVTGTVDAKTGTGDVDFTKQAMKAYLEIDTVGAVGSQVNTDGTLKQSQQFILTGSKGARNFTFNAGASVADVVSQIHASADSTGVDASLVFNSKQKVDATQTAQAGVFDATAARAAAAEITTFGNILETGGAAVETGIEQAAGTIAGLQYGLNTDGQGKIYVKFTGFGTDGTDATYELYKDASMSEASKVGFGKAGEASVEYNNSKLKGLELTTVAKDAASLLNLRGVYIGMGGIVGTSGKAADGATNSVVYGGNLAKPATPAEDDRSFDESLTAIYGIELGKNTDAAGKIYTKTVVSDKGVQVFAYKDQQMREEDMVAKSDLMDAGSKTFILNEIRNADDTAGTGLGIVLSAGGNDSFAALAADAASTENIAGTIEFKNLAARVYSQDYGADAKIQVQAIKGGLFTYYDNPGDASTGRVIDAGDKGITKAVYGQNASLSVNGQLVKTTGLDLNMATQDLQARMRFNEGIVGSTTIAQVGYGTGSIFSKIGALNLSKTDKATGDNADLSSYLCNAGHNTTEKIGNFTGGMTLQLGEGEGDQERTVLSIQSMAIANLGMVTKGGYWETGSAVYSEKTFTMQDMFGGGQASLAVAPTLSMEIIDQAIKDVSDQRARLGSFQANMLQTNMNNLSVAVENIQKTESAIRDTDMATEMTEFTKNQVLQNAAMSMLAQANAQSQAALQLLG